MVSFGNDGSTAPAGKTEILTPQSRVSGNLSLDNSYGSAAMTFEEAMNYALTLPGTELRPAMVDLASRRMAAAIFLSGTSHRKPLRCI